MSATDYSICFNNSASDLDLIESYERTQEIFEHLLNDVTTGMNEKDQVRFVIFSRLERVIQSSQDFRLNDTVVVDIVHVEAPQGSGRKRTVLDIGEFLHKKRSVITIQNDDDLCLARALVTAIAKIEKDPRHKSLTNPRNTV